MLLTLPRARFVAAAFAVCGLLHIVVNGPSWSQIADIASFTETIEEDPMETVIRNAATHSPFYTSTLGGEGANSTVVDREIVKRFDDDLWQNNSMVMKPQNASLRECSATPPGLVGPIRVFQDAPSLEEIQKLYSDVGPGGHGKPENCLARHRMALVIPFRDRDEHLRILLHNMHALLKKQQIDYAIIIVEQIHNQTFNRGKLMNVGFLEAMRLYQFECFIFHDVDLLPEDDRNLYSCPTSPRHMSVAVDKFNYKLPYGSIFGGISALTVSQLRAINGFPNDYWGWGGEDDDLSERVQLAGFKISRYPASIARYKMIKHQRESTNPVNKCRYKLMARTKKRWKHDGINSINYKVLDVDLRPLYTRILVDLMEKDSKAWLKKEVSC